MPRNTFSDDAARRIAETVRAHEREPRDLTRDGEQPIWVPIQIRRFELTENLAFGGSASATLLLWRDSNYETRTIEGFTVYDAFSKFNQQDRPTGQDGARGYAVLLGGRWEIVQMQHQARWIEFILAEALATSDASADCDGVTYKDGYEPNTAVTTIYNKSASSDYIFSGDDNAEGSAKYDPATGHYIIDQLECPSE